MSNSSRQMRIDQRAIGSNQPVYLIAHIGLNHNGHPAEARRLIKQADAAGADAVSMPVYRTDSVVSEQAELVPDRRDDVGSLARNQRNMLGRCELAPETIEELTSLARDRNLDVIPSPLDPDSFARMQTLHPPALLLSPGDLTFHPLVKQFAETDRPLLLSTGLASLDELDRVVEQLRKAQSDPEFALLYQVCCYPPEPNDLDLNTIPTFRSRYGHPVGFLDHTSTHQAAESAVTLGACVIGKYLTTNTEAEGAHHAISLEPERFHAFAQRIRTLETSLGSGEKQQPESEREIRPFLRRSLAVTCSLDEGETLHEEHMTALRPAEGIPADQLEQVKGTCLTTHKHAGEILYEQDITPNV